MLFNSFDFGFFLVLAFLMYWGIGAKRRKSQNLFLLLASYFFYACWDWRFLGLLIASSLVDYWVGIQIGKSNHSLRKKGWLSFSILWNLGVLFTFKYFGFFVENFEALFGIPHTTEYNFWNVAIPLGLSFYTFQTMGYSIDVYRKHITPTKSLLEFSCFVSFFPQLVAGPIERAKKLLPQFERERHFQLQDAKEGLRQILWGLFKKIIVAEKLGMAVQMAFNQPEQYHSITLIYAIILFCFQVYCDFSGYTDIALGTAKLFGFKLSRNFNLPYLSKSLSELWQRWHITLTRWFTDYVYIPFVKSFKHRNAFIRAIGLLITMTLVGFWHGAKWTFVIFGLLNGLILVVERLPLFPKKETLQNKLQQAPRWVPLLYVFVVFTIIGLFFRAESLKQAWTIITQIYHVASQGAITTLIGWKVGYLLLMIAAEMAFRKYEYPLQKLETWLPKPLRWGLYYLVIFIIIRYAEPKEAFIYFQF